MNELDLELSHFTPRVTLEEMDHVAADEVHIAEPSDLRSRSHPSHSTSSHPSLIQTLWPKRGSDGWYQLLYITSTAVLMSALLLSVQFIFLHLFGRTTLLHLSSQVAVGTVRLLYQLYYSLTR